MKCPECLNIIPGKAKFCPVCGNNLYKKQIDKQNKASRSAEKSASDSSKRQKYIIAVICLLLVIMLAAVCCIIILADKENKTPETFAPQSASDTAPLSGSETAAFVTANTSAEDKNVNIILNAGDFSENTTESEIISKFPGGTYRSMNWDGEAVIGYLYKNYSFNFYNGMLQSIFIDFETGIYTDPANCPNEPYPCIREEFLPLFGLNGGTVSAEDGLFIATDCGIHLFICHYNDIGIRSAQLCYTDLVHYYN